MRKTAQRHMAQGHDSRRKSEPPRAVARRLPLVSCRFGLLPATDAPRVGVTAELASSRRHGAACTPLYRPVLSLPSVPVQKGKGKTESGDDRSMTNNPNPNRCRCRDGVDVNVLCYCQEGLWPRWLSVEIRGGAVDELRITMPA